MERRSGPQLLSELCHESGALFGGFGASSVPARTRFMDGGRLTGFGPGSNPSRPPLDRDPRSGWMAAYAGVSTNRPWAWWAALDSNQ